MTSIRLLVWLVMFHDPVTEACFGAGKMKELEPSEPSIGDQAWGLSRVSLQDQTDQDGVGRLQDNSHAESPGHIGAVKPHISPTYNSPTCSL